MHTNTPYTKDRVLRRMESLAVKQLKLKNINEIDPVIHLFVQALAEEIYKSAREINSTETRIIEKVSDILVPDTSNFVCPSHGILHAAPFENDYRITQETTFIYDNPQNKDASQLVFHPVCNTIVRDGAIRYQISNGVLYEFDNDNSKEPISQSKELKSLHENTCWIGIELSASIENLNGLSFYFDFPSADRKEKHLNRLPYTLWSLNGIRLNVEQELYTLSQTFENIYMELFCNTELDYSYRINNHILSYYKKHFLTITENLPFDEQRQTFPEQLRPYYPQYIIDELSRKLVWLEIKFPLAFDTSTLEQMSININTFPVVNKRLHEITAYVNALSQVIPLTMDNHETFLSVYKVIDSGGYEYYELPFTHTPNQKYRTYSLRKGGIERYDTRDAKKSLVEFADRMEGLITFYSNKANDDDTSRQTQKEIHLLAQYFRQIVNNYTDKRSIGIYLLPDYSKGDDILFVKYWTHSNEQANNIPVDSPMKCFMNNGLIPSTIRLQTATTGGKALPVSINNNELYHVSLKSRSLIVTNNDITKFCLEEFRDMVKGVEIRLGYMQCYPPEKGFLRTIDVYVTVKEQVDKSFHHQLSFHIKKKLKENSPITSNYRIFVKN